MPADTTAVIYSRNGIASFNVRSLALIQEVRRLGMKTSAIQDNPVARTPAAARSDSRCHQALSATLARRAGSFQ